MKTNLIINILGKDATVSQKKQPLQFLRWLSVEKIKH